jgi:hypothetical protein
LGRLYQKKTPLLVLSFGHVLGKKKKSEWVKKEKRKKINCIKGFFLLLSE